MKHVVVYTEHPSPAEERLLRAALGPTCAWTSVLPLVSRPFASDGEVQAALDVLRKLVNASPPGHTQVFVQGAEHRIPAVSLADAERAPRVSEHWHVFLRKFAADPGAVALRAKEHQRCWLLAASLPRGGIPPGIGFLLDKSSMCVMERRFIDVVDLDNALI